MKNCRIVLLSLAVCILLPATLHATCQAVNATYLQSGLGDMTTDNSDVWSWNSFNYAKGSKQGGVTGNLFTPALDFTGADAVTLSFKHAHKFAGTPSQELTLWVTADYQGSYAASSWQQLTIDPYSTNTDWTWADVSIDVPVAYVGSNTVFCFKYISTASNYATWEVKNLHIESSCPESNDPPVALPNIGDGRLKVCAQNLQNYYYNYNTGRGNYTPAEFAEKTRKIVDAMIWVDADIYAFCELEAKPIILTQLADSMNARVEGTPYAAAADGIDVDWDESCNCNLKSGFIYRTDKVRPIGSSAPSFTANYYKNTMRVQAFEELSSGERLTLSMNHFKAKDNSEDAGNATRELSATRLTENLPSLALDPDILILGDLNCEVGENPLNIIEQAGYEEQLLKYNTNPYSHCYNGGELIDHVYANASMAAQITGAGLFHISTYCGTDASANANHRYSDHDPYLVGINLVSTHSTECEEADYNYLTSTATSLGEMRAISVSGTYNWAWDGSYKCAKVADKGGEDWLLTPAYDLSVAGAVSIEFDHTIGYAIDMANQQTMWVTGNFSDVATSEWTQLTIPTYPAGTNWTFVHATVNVPTTALGANTVFGFKQNVPNDASSNKPTWEIKNLKVSVTCEGTPSGVQDTPAAQHADKQLIDGQLYLVMPDGSRYNIVGVQIR